MDTHVKEGQLYVQHQKFGKKWKKNWFVLYPASQNGIARLEFYDCGSGGGGGSDKPTNTKKLDKKIIRLSECISILPALTESCPKDNMSAFCVETNDKTYVFAAEKHVTTDWVEKMCEIAFQGGTGTLSSSDSNGQDLQMAENLIYYSREEVNEFWVSVQRTEASERCGLMGSYWLKADGETLILKDPKSKKNLLVWPYKLLRRYGRDRVMFSFEAGRRCESGPGNFTFETKQGNEIFQIVEGAIREQKAQAEDRHSSCLSLDPDCPALQQIRSAISEGNIREPDGDSGSGGSKPGSADGVFSRREGADGKHLKGRTLPEPPAPVGVGGTPPRSPMHRGSRSGPSSLDDQSNLYSEPADSVRIPPSPSECLYSDPVDSLKSSSPRLRPLGDEGGSRSNSNNNKPEPFYSDIYDRVTLDLTQRAGGMSLDVVSRRPAEGSRAEHIYDEPEGRATGQSSSLPPIPSVYDEARPEGQAWRTRGMDESQGHEIPYNSALDDYSVPAYGKSQTPHATARPKVPRPLPAPKPAKGGPRKEPPPLPQGKTGANLNNNNSSSSNQNRGGGGVVSKQAELYSKVSKHKPTQANTWYPHPALRSPDIIYDNLGDI
ncbi:docking protein 1b isoform X2 [Engraulis encrasicolus]|uniref:docking protein 1b isoform X2 n=1 Tax=Engraulis encrasicolus TaxID=184585 RepID=UPI002FD2A0DE